MRVGKSFHPRLGMLVHIVVLDLTEIPVIRIQQFLEGNRAAVERKADIFDLTGCLFPFNPFFQPELAKTPETVDVV